MCSQLHAERTNKQQRLHLLEASDKDPDAEDGPATVVVCITKREKAESGAQSGNNALKVSHSDFEEEAFSCHPSSSSI